ncbi:MAG TPA: 5-formyltetrahydrofolate cyclo-ligase [Stenomitos sp.]
MAISQNERNEAEVTQSIHSESAAAAKQALRHQLIAQRQSLDPTIWETKNNQICQHLQQSDWFRQAHCILVYQSTRKEPDLSALWQQDRTTHLWGLPRCDGTDLLWHQWQPDQPHQLQRGRFGILEPLPTLPQLKPEQVDLILVPAVACDRQGYRLGYGGGFYDRLLSQPEWGHIKTVGILYDFAYVERLNIEAWDCALQAVCTETGFRLSALQSK